jgi:hypothetical protein
MSWVAVGAAAVSVGTAVAKGVSKRKARKRAEKAIKKAPKYKLNKEAAENQNLARSQAFGRDTAIQTQEENIEQEAANAGSSAREVSSSTSDLLGAIANINANKNQNLRGLSQDEASIKNMKMGQLYGMNNAMIDEQDKKWNYNKNMPYQMKVAMLREQAAGSAEQSNQSTSDASGSIVPAYSALSTKYGWGK